MNDNVLLTKFLKERDSLNLECKLSKEEIVFLKNNMLNILEESSNVLSSSDFSRLLVVFSYNIGFFNSKIFIHLIELAKEKKSIDILYGALSFAHRIIGVDGLKKTIQKKILEDSSLLSEYLSKNLKALEANLIYNDFELKYISIPRHFIDEIHSNLILEGFSSIR